MKAIGTVVVGVVFQRLGVSTAIFRNKAFIERCNENAVVFHYLGVFEPTFRSPCSQLVERLLGKLLCIVQLGERI
ncbi:Uncharacterised protein [Segatella copri]|nr:Uncharacterised protein [Segatella copri]